MRGRTNQKSAQNAQNEQNEHLSWTHIEHDKTIIIGGQQDGLLIPIITLCIYIPR